MLVGGSIEHIEGVNARQLTAQQWIKATGKPAVFPDMVFCIQSDLSFLFGLSPQWYKVLSGRRRNRSVVPVSSSHRSRPRPPLLSQHGCQSTEKAEWLCPHEGCGNPDFSIHLGLTILYLWSLGFKFCSPFVSS